MTSTDLSEDDVEWLRRLQVQIWTKPEPQRRSARSPPPRPEQIRPVTTEEWERVCAAIERHKLPTTIFNVDFGFGIALCIREHSPIPEGEPDFLLAVSYEQLPNAPKDVRKLWDHAWRLFEKIVRTKKNLDALAFYGMDPPEDRQSYEY